MNSIQIRTIKNVLWAGSGRFFSQAVHYIFLTILAWFLQPSDFGVLGLALIVVTILIKVGDLGMGAALIQRKIVDLSYLNTAFWMNLGVNSLLGLVVVVLAQPIAVLMNDARAASILVYLAGMFPIYAFLLVPKAMLERALRFDKIARSEVAGEIAYGLVGVMLALTGLGVWSLVGAVLVRPTMQLVVLWQSYRWRPSFSFGRPAFRDMTGFGVRVMGATLLNQVTANLDYFVVGRFLGASALGYYTLAFQLAVVPSQKLTNVLFQVTFPSFSRLQGDVARLRCGFLQMIETLLLVLMPFALCLVGLSPLFIQTLYAERWTPTSVLMQVLALAGLFYGFDVTHAIYYATGRPGIRLVLIAIQLTFFAIFIIWFGIEMGMIGIAWSASLSVALSALVGMVVTIRVVGIRFVSLIKAVKRPFLTTLLTAGPAFLIASDLTGHLEAVVRLGLSVSVIGLLYSGFLFLFYRDRVLATTSRLLMVGQRPKAKKPVLRI